MRQPELKVGRQNASGRRIAKEESCAYMRDRKKPGVAGKERMR